MSNPDCWTPEYNHTSTVMYYDTFSFFFYDTFSYGPLVSGIVFYIVNTFLLVRLIINSYLINTFQRDLFKIEEESLEPMRLYLLFLITNFIEEAAWL